MNMKISEMIGCCTVRILHGFPNSNSHWLRNPQPKTVEGLTVELKEYARRQRRSFESSAFIIATTNSNQRLAAKFLRSLGFKPTRGASKKDHPETTVRIWRIKVEDFITALGI